MALTMEIVQLPMYVYIVIVSALEKHGFEFPFTILLAIISSALLSPLFLACHLVFTIYKCLIRFVLCKIYANVFIDLMEGLDSICCNQHNCIPNVLLLIDSSDNLSILYNKTLTMIRASMRSEHKKIFYSRAWFMGYHYFYKNGLKPKDYILIANEKQFQPPIQTKAELSELFKGYDNIKLPDDGRALLQVVLFRNNVLHEGKEVKLVAFRLHHSLGDGKAIMNLFASVFGDVKLSVNGTDLKRKPSDTPIGKLIAEVKRLKEWPPSLQDDNALRGYDLIEEKHLAWFSDANNDCMNKIRLLRKKIPGVTFLDVINTCISSSLYDFCEKKRFSTPETVIGGVVLSPAIYSFSYGVGKFSMSNRFSCAAFHMPLAYGDCKPQTRLRHIKKEYDTVKRCVDVHFNYWTAQNLCETIPSPIVKCICSNVPVTFGVSSLPGCESFNIFGGCAVKDFIFMLPNSPRCGLHFVIYTYGGSFRIALTADKSIIASHPEAQSIINGVIEHLDGLHRLCLDGKLNL